MLNLNIYLLFIIKFNVEIINNGFPFFFQNFNLTKKI